MKSRSRAFTLVELLLVVFILAAVAATTASLATQADEQFRFDDTRARREEVRRAILGDPLLKANGQPVVSGFAADVGRAPVSLRELLDPALPPPAWSFDPVAQQWAGWRGPYLRGDTIVDPSDPIDGQRRVYRDGWANLGPDPAAEQDNYGWLYASASGLVSLASYGSDGAPGGAQPYASDQPPDPTLVRPHDVELSVRSWVVSVTLQNRSGATLAAQAFRLRLFAPRLSPDGSALEWPLHRSAAVTMPSDLADGGDWSADFAFPAAPESDGIPCGVRTLNLVLDDGSSLATPPRAASVTLTAGSTLQPLGIRLLISP